MDCNCEGYIGRVYRVISEAYPSTARSRITSSLMMLSTSSRFRLLGPLAENIPKHDAPASTLDGQDNVIKNISCMLSPFFHQTKSNIPVPKKKKTHYSFYLTIVLLIT